MKICTVTFNYSENYGAQLQCYALQKALSDCGADVKVANLRLNKERILRKFKLSRSGLRELFFDITHLSRYKDFKVASNRFIDFQNKMLSLTKVIKSTSEFSSVVGGVDVCIVGSDQVWNPLFYGKPHFKEPFLLKNIPSNIQKYSYAASVGYPTIPKEVESEFKIALKTYEEISLRENSTKNYIQTVLGIPARTDIDPIFLLKKEDWYQQINPDRLIDEPYILCFELSTPAYFDKFLKRIKNEYRQMIKVVLLSRNFYSMLSGDINIYDAGPWEFLRLIRDAEIVISTSFHACAFSVLFNKNFFACLSKHPPERIINLLSIVGLKDRIISEKNFGSVNLENSINYSEANCKIENERNKSLSYIKRIIRGKK